MLTVTLTENCQASQPLSELLIQPDALDSEPNELRERNTMVEGPDSVQRSIKEDSNTLSEDLHRRWSPTSSWDLKNEQAGPHGSGKA